MNVCKSVFSNLISLGTPSLILLLISALYSVNAALGSCPDPNSQDTVRDLTPNRKACTDVCNTNGYCCNNDLGGCQQLTCSMGCFLAWHSNTEAECIQKCKAGNEVELCDYKPPGIPNVDFFLCIDTSEECGCPSDIAASYNSDYYYQYDYEYYGYDYYNEYYEPAEKNLCGSGCEAGCKYAKNIAPFYGQSLSQSGLSAAIATQKSKETELIAALDKIKSYITEKIALNAKDLVTQTNVITANANLLKTSTALLTKAFDLVDVYESSAFGPLFINTGYLKRPAKNTKGEEIPRAMFAIQQSIIDEVYNAYPSVLEDCSRSLFENRGWKTASHFPGDPVKGSSSQNYLLGGTTTVKINALVPATYGFPVSFWKHDATKPTGLYLEAGKIGQVEVPDALVNTGYSIRVGSHTVDLSERQEVENRRLDRVSTVFPITQKTTLFGNPLGGGVYVEVPYLADVGVVEVTFGGNGLMKAPFYQRTSFKTTTLNEWLSIERTAPGPWAVFETDKFMLNVPRSWIYALDDPESLMIDYDTCMDATSEFIGQTPQQRNRKVLYLQADFNQAFNDADVPGYPQVNVVVDPKKDYKGYASKEWMIAQPAGYDVCYHELGHSQDISQYRGEDEAIINFLFTYIRHMKFGDEFETAFKKSQTHESFGIDEAAVHWMIAENFRDGKEMGYEDDNNQFAYQQRGYAKYADIVRLFGWESYTTFYYNENVEYQKSGKFNVDDGLSETDSRTYRWSLATGHDVTPLIHFWGIFPEDPQKLAQKISENTALIPNRPSEKVRCLLIRYKGLIPITNKEFNDFYDTVYLDDWYSLDDYQDERYGWRWFEAWTDFYGLNGEGEKAVARVDALLKQYFPTSLSDSCAGITTGAPGEPDVPRPTRFSWQPPGVSNV